MSSVAAPLPSYPGLAIEQDETVWNGMFPLQRIRFRHCRFDGTLSRLRTWELWRRGRAVAVLPYDPRTDKVVLIEQFRLPALAAGVDPVMVEVPAGLCEPGEEVAVTLRREAQEELGLPLGRITTIGDYVLSPGGSDERVWVHAGEVATPPCGADGIVGLAGLASEAEDIRVRVWDAETAIASAFAGKMSNVITALSLFWLAGQRPRLRAEWGNPA